MTYTYLPISLDDVIKHNFKCHNISTITALSGTRKNSFDSLKKAPGVPSLNGHGKQIMINKCKSRLINKAKKLNCNTVANVKYNFSYDVAKTSMGNISSIATLIAYGVAFKM